MSSHGAAHEEIASILPIWKRFHSLKTYYVVIGVIWDEFFGTKNIAHLDTHITKQIHGDLKQTDGNAELATESV